MQHDRREFLKVAAGASAAVAFGTGVSAMQSPSSEDDLTRLSLTEASDRVRQRRISPVELTRACLGRAAEEFGDRRRCRGSAAWQ
jgi:hypothetical protein